MAKTETFSAACSKVGSFSYYNNFTLYVTLTDRDGSSSTNKSYVDYKVYCSSNGSGSLDSKHAIYFSINGSEKVNKTVTWTASSPYISLTIAEGTIEVTHDDDGNKTIPFSASIKANSYGVSASKSGNFSLEKINRYFTSTPSISASSKTLTSITFKWSTSQTCDRITYTLNGTSKGEIWTGSATSGTLTVSGLSPNTTYSIYTSCRRKDSQLSSNSNTISVKTYDIARLTEAPNVNIGSSHTIKWTNPGGATTSLKLCKTDGTQVISYGTVTGTSKSVTPTASTIYALTPKSNSITLRYILTTTQGSYTATNYKDCKFSVTNSNPTFSNFTYKDTDTTVTALTGNNQTIVKGYSNVQGIVSTANKATAKNSATMSKYRLSIGEATAEVAYSSSAQVTTTIANVSSNSFTMYAIDSRGNSTGKTITASTYINYSPIKVNSISAVRTNSVTSATTLKFSGYVWNGSFGSVTNSIVTCYYRYRLSTSSTWTTGETTITPTKSGTSFSFSGLIAGDLGANGFDIDNSYVVQVIVADKLSGNSSNPATFTLGPGTPAMAIYKNNVAIGQRYDTAQSTNKFQVYGRASHSQGTTVKMLSAGQGTKGYMLACKIVISGTYNNQDIWLKVLQRNKSGEILIRFASIEGSDPGLAVFQKIGSINAYMVRSATSSWYLYIQKTEAYDNIEIVELYKGIYNDKVTFEWVNSTVESLPSGYNTATAYRTKSLTSVQHSALGTNNDFHPDISFISYWNGAYDSANASNLRYCYQGTIQAKPTSLYDNSSGTNGTVTLSSSAANFSYLEIFFRNNSNNYNSVVVYSPNSKKVWLDSGTHPTDNGATYYKTKVVTISGTSITVTSHNSFDIYNSNVPVTAEQNNIYITKVNGYK